MGTIEPPPKITFLKFLEALKKVETVAQRRVEDVLREERFQFFGSKYLYQECTKSLDGININISQVNQLVFALWSSEKQFQHLSGQSCDWPVDMKMGRINTSIQDWIWSLDEESVLILLQNVSGTSQVFMVISPGIFFQVLEKFYAIGRLQELKEYFQDNANFFNANFYNSVARSIPHRSVLINWRNLIRGCQIEEILPGLRYFVDYLLR